MLTTVLVDVGGTLWPERAVPNEAQLRLERMAAAFPTIARPRLQVLINQLNQGATAWDQNLALAQDTRGLIETALQDLGLSNLDAASVRRAMSVPASEGILFDGADGLLRGLKDLGLSCVIVSNTAWRDAAAYRADFETLGIAAWIDHVVSSVDTGYRKPHKAIFEIALGAVDSTAATALMIGDSEEKDIAPAEELGMRSVLVSLAGTPVTSTRATHQTASLKRVPAIVQEMAGA